MSATANNLLIEKKVIEGDKVKAWKPKKTKSADEKAGPGEVKSAETKTETEQTTASVWHLGET